ncbi:MAG: hypothetical protein Kow0059_13580 [Candidatus Sumerlaeia bacterium]
MSETQRSELTGGHGGAGSEPGRDVESPAPMPAGAARLVIADAVVMAIVFAAAFWLRFKSGLMGFRAGSEGYRDLDYYLFWPCGVALWVLAIYVVRGYEGAALRWGATALVRLASGSVLAVALVLVGDAVARGAFPEWFGLSRVYLLLSAIAGLGGLAAERIRLTGTCCR